MSKETQTTAEASTDNAAPPVQLALNDIVAAVQIIDIAASRGAFRGEELSQVGGVRDRLGSFLKANLPPQEEESGEDDPETDPSE